MKPKTVKSFRHGDSTVMTIPAPMAEELGIGAGDYLTVFLDKDSLKVIKAPPIEAEALRIAIGGRPEGRRNFAGKPSVASKFSEGTSVE